ncbi:UNVERIFIED_CONTAM: hypothetical protein Sradi_2495400 [Sesamum radiatum]|uniref:Ty3-gypsy retrotransposon protein n=1 Tax=Sesamum radiatum TaxID=300843 RepID=A0AAW2SM71_SESRA
MSKKLKISSQMTPVIECVQKDLILPSHASEDNGNKYPSSSRRFVSSYSFTTNTASIMVMNATTIEEQLASLTRVIKGFREHVQNQDAQISRLINKTDNVDMSHIMGNKLRLMMKQRYPQNQLYPKKDKFAKEFLVSSNGLVHLDVNDYQLPKFHQFDGKGSPKQQEVHLMETCNNVGTYDNHLVKQFVRSLKGSAFDWYTDLEAASIDGWEQLEQEFLNHFYSTWRAVNMIEL